MIPIFQPLCKRRVNYKKNKDTLHYAESYRKCKPQPLHPKSRINSWDKICICGAFFKSHINNPFPQSHIPVYPDVFPTFIIVKGRGENADIFDTFGPQKSHITTDIASQHSPKDICPENVDSRLDITCIPNIHPILIAQRMPSKHSEATCWSSECCRFTLNAARNGLQVTCKNITPK